MVTSVNNAHTQRVAHGAVVVGWRLQALNDRAGAVAKTGAGGTGLHMPAAAQPPAGGSGQLSFGGPALLGRKVECRHRYAGAALPASGGRCLQREALGRSPLQHQPRPGAAVTVGFAILHQVALPVLAGPLQVGDELEPFPSPQGQRHAQGKTLAAPGVAGFGSEGGERATALQVAVVVGLALRPLRIGLRPKRQRSQVPLPAGLQPPAANGATLGVERAVGRQALGVGFAVILLPGRGMQGQAAVEGDPVMRLCCACCHHAHKRQQAWPCLKAMQTRSGEGIH